MKSPVAVRRLGMGVVWLLVAACAPEPAVQVLRAVAPATPPGVSVAAVYLEIESPADDVLTQIVTPLADEAQIHTVTAVDGMMQMRPVDTIPLDAHKPVRFAPGGMHLMLMNLHRPLLVDQSFPVDLHFQKAGTITAQVQVVPPGSVSATH